MKKIIALITLIVALFSLTVYANNTEDKAVEISFKVGDSTLMINGSPITVEKPYVVGEGTTLVPVRVITEAFNAKVNWVDETREVIIDYPDVHIVMQIGNKTVTVNDHTETLLAAPELPGDITMVPLRFISETFDAEVNYNNETEEITVVKTFTEMGQTVSGITTMDYIGDSYYGWSMETPMELIMDDRTFNGLCTIFEYGEEGLLEIDIIPNSNKDDLERIYISEKDALSYCTLSVAEKLTDKNGNRYIHFAGDFSGNSMENLIFVTDKYIYDVYASVDNKETLNEVLVPIINTFSLNFDSSKTYDMSTVNDDGTSTFKNEKHGFSVNIPIEWYDYNSEDSNKMMFESEDDDYLFYIEITSKTDKANANIICENSRRIDKKSLNSKAKISEITEYKINDKISGVSYTVEVNGTKGEDGYGISVYFDYEGYNYEIFYSSKNFDKQLIKKILDSISVEAIDSKKVGTLLADISESGTYILKADSWSISLPYDWSGQTEENSALLSFFDGVAMVSISSQKLQGVTPAELKTFATETLNELIKDISNKKVEDVQSIKINGQNFLTFTIQKASDAGDLYATFFIGEVKGQVLEYLYVRGEASYKSDLDKEVLEILNTLTVK